MKQRLPDYLKRGIIDTEKTREVRSVLKTNCLSTVCEEARCPNKAQCYAKNTATFLIMGSVCTRNCRFCNITKGITKPLDPDEPKKVAQAVKSLGLKYAVVTSVTRDDLDDGGAGHFAQTIREIRKLDNIIPTSCHTEQSEVSVVIDSSEYRLKTKPEELCPQNDAEYVRIEVLTPDFKGRKESIDAVIEAKPDVFNHNIETVEALYDTVRPMANYRQSLNFLDYIKNKDPKMLTKSGLMVGLGETKEQIIKVFEDLKSVKCDIVTVGQYIPPSKKHLAVAKYYEMHEYEELTKIAKEIGIKHTMFSPLTRSSYQAVEIFNDCTNYG